MVRVFWSLIFGFLFGVFLGSLFPLGLAAVFFCALLASGLFALALASTHRASALILACFFLACGVGLVRMGLVVIPDDAALRAQIDSKVAIRGVVFEEPDAREGSVRVSLKTKSGVGVLAVVPLHTAVAYGDLVSATGTLRLPESFDSGEGRAFDYPAYLALRGIRYELAFAQVEKIGEASRNPVTAGAIWVKQTYLAGLARVLPEPHAGLAGGITAGDKRALGGELTDIFREVGLIHIIVLSGYNIMIVIIFFEALFRSARKEVRIGVAIVVALFFTLITGLASASVRAAAMAVIAALGKATGRLYLASRALSVVACGMVMWNPLLLAHDPGFQLSIIATWGLISIAPLIEKRLTFVTEVFDLRGVAAATVGTQIAVLPLLLYSSGLLSVVALPANLLTLVVVPYAMLASFIAGVAGVAGSLGVIVALPAYMLLSYIIFVAEWLAALPFATISVGAFGFGWLVIAYVLLAAAAHEIVKVTP